MKEGGRMSFPLYVFNPSDYGRTGHITVPWQLIVDAVKEAKLRPEKLGLFDDETKTPLPFQIDPVDPSTPAHPVLSFTLNKWLPPGTDDYGQATGSVIVDESSTPLSQESFEPKIEGHGHSVELTNSRLRVQLNLTPILEDQRTSNAAYAGAVTSVQLDGAEVLDSNIGDIWGHDPEKRLQLDYIQLPRSAWDFALYQRISMFDRPFEIAASGSGPVRAWVTLASAPFEYDYWDPRTRAQFKLECRLYRIFSLFAGATHLIEELFVRGSPEGSVDRTGSVHLNFTASYFAYLHYYGLDTSRFENVPDWFAVSNLQRPFLGYGFCTDVHTRSLTHPHPDFPNWRKATNSLSWQLFPCRAAKCLHAFSRFYPDDSPRPGESFEDAESRKCLEARAAFERQAGHSWYEHVYKPLRAGLKKGAIYVSQQY